jgi:hypothetical protein
VTVQECTPSHLPSLCSAVAAAAISLLSPPHALRQLPVRGNGARACACWRACGTAAERGAQRRATDAAAVLPVASVLQLGGDVYIREALRAYVGRISFRHAVRAAAPSQTPSIHAVRFSETAPVARPTRRGARAAAGHEPTTIKSR